MHSLHNIQHGRPYPLGATLSKDGINFSVFSQHATAVKLLLYAADNNAPPFQIIDLSPEHNKTYFFWHIYVKDLSPGVLYTWSVDGPQETTQHGYRFSPETELLDPWAKAVSTSRWDRDKALNNKVPNNQHYSMRAAVVDETYNWNGDKTINQPINEAIIYELHTGGFTRSPTSEVALPGTFLGLTEKLNYIKQLGITDIELMPVMAFDEQDVPASVSARGLENYWGYSTHSFFSPHPGYCSNTNSAKHRDEFRDLVQAVHKQGMSLILDVAFNHTAEGGKTGTTINFKGFSNELFYHLNPVDKSEYRDYTGCGNTVNCNHPLVSNFIINCLTYWVEHMHVDGFRFDLASVFSRNEEGHPMANAPLPWNIEYSSSLSKTKLIAEAWDAVGLYQVGEFAGFRWSEWNGRYRDVIRRFIAGEKGLVSAVATCLSGSSDLYQARNRLPGNSINFITCHDGFTLYDLVSYNNKDNILNGEHNRDGHNENLSWNCGTEGDTKDRKILSLRHKQAKNFMSILFLSQGVPMILAGDEVLKSQQGNNNAYCQNNELGWFDWGLVEKNAFMLRFVRELIAFRKRHPSLRRARFLSGNKMNGSDIPDVSWHGLKLNQPQWDDPQAQFLAFTLCAVQHSDAHLHIMINMSSESIKTSLPTHSHRTWYPAINTALISPRDIIPPSQQTPYRGSTLSVAGRSVVVFESRNP